ncbi:carboxylesterase/lipase family protein [Azospirillum lipoferum]|uniref:Carboxylic ester hydrolase n=1 Tax=Azospirillum lipoferum (strain 4B) TaxID=862719 RepID=G7ZC98_AZOL4|nr:carboxylesterase family protein [Azospirillum lipoferum]CBS89211.1 putative carboxylesterase [Azospirillum lipoferum 4B]
MTAIEDVVATTPFGRLTGKRIGGVSSFKRVPYAAPPVGARRFALPGEPISWTGIRPATAPGPIPPQLPSRLDDVMGAYPAAQNEDCLHLDIWTPRSLDDKAPVLVFIHGGGFMTGGGSLPCYDGQLIAERSGLVVVTITYRLGTLGFLPIEGLAAPNLGLHDQIAALRWIRQAIGAFGGDPDRITVAGQSAGAYSIASLLGLPVGRSLFNQAILMSAPTGIKLRTPEECKPIVQGLLELLGLEPGQTAALRDIPIDTLIEAQGKLLRRPTTTPGDITPPFMPAYDGVLIPRDPLASVRDGSAGWCSTVVGVTREEYAAFHAGNPMLAGLTEEQLLAAIAGLYGDRAGAVVSAARTGRVPTTPQALLSDLRSDDTFIQPNMDFAEAQLRHCAPTGARTFVYRFDWQSPNAALGACHCLDLPFLFGNLAVWQEAAPMLHGANRAELEDLCRLFQGALLRFAAQGDPNGPDTPAWPSHDRGRAVLHVDRRIYAAGLIG